MAHVLELEDLVKHVQDENHELEEGLDGAYLRMLEVKRTMFEKMRKMQADYEAQLFELREDKRIIALSHQALTGKGA